MKRPIAILLAALTFIGWRAIADDKLTIVDADPGTDDFAALLTLAYGADKVEFPQVCVATFGNFTRDITARNLVLATKFLGRKPRLIYGADRPYSGKDVKQNFFHGPQAMGGMAEKLMRQYDLDEKKVAAMFEEPDKLKDAVMSAKDVTYIAVGPLTTLARLIDQEPAVTNHIKRVYVMGGGIHVFNVVQHKAEYNFFSDPEAVKKVIGSSLDITLFPLDITIANATLSLKEIEEFKASGAGEMFIACSMTNRASNIATGQTKDSAVYHDTLPAIYALDRSGFIMKDIRIVAAEYGHLDADAKGRVVHVALKARKNLMKDTLMKAITTRNQIMGEKERGERK